MLLFIRSVGYTRLFERSATLVLLAVDCMINIVCKAVLDQGVEYVLEGIVSSMFG